ncbi:vacuolar protein-sorting-associated protein 25 [Diutina rugosa]
MYEFPKLHSYPAFYSKQRNLTILDYQLEGWTQLILDYCRHFKVTSLTIQGRPKYSQSESDLDRLPSIFENKTIDRVVTQQFRQEIFRHMVQKQVAATVTPGKFDQGIYVYWRSLDEWGEMLYDHAVQTGQLDTVMTIYELTSEDSSLPEPLKQLDQAFLLTIIADLKKKNKVQILKEGGTVAGVKFGSG